MLHISGPGAYDLAIVGESNYQRALIRIAGRRSTKENRRVECAAVLHLETDNPHDRNAVRVTMRGETVGYVPRAEAADLRAVLARYNILDGQQVEVDAVIVGGRQRNNYGVWLDLSLNGDNELEDGEDDNTDLKTGPPPATSAAKQVRPPRREQTPARPAAPVPVATAPPAAGRRTSPLLYIVSGLLATVITVLAVGGLAALLMSLF